MTEKRNTEAKEEIEKDMEHTDLRTDLRTESHTDLRRRLFGKEGVIATLTLNPSLDVFVTLDGKMKIGETNRSKGSATFAGGKGINVSRVLSGLGLPTVSYFPVGGAAGESLKKLVLADGIPYRTTPTAADTRTNYKFSEESGLTTEVNGLGGPVSAYELNDLLDVLASDFPIISTLVISGSVPYGVDGIIYSTVINRAKSYGIGTVLDTSGKALSLGIESSPDLIKPNRRELSELLRCSILTKSDVIDSCTYIYEKYGTSVLCTLGADGAVFVGCGGVSEINAPKVKVTTTTGAGDSFLAGFLYGLQKEKNKPFSINNALRSGSICCARALGGRKD